MRSFSVCVLILDSIFGIDIEDRRESIQIFHGCHPDLFAFDKFQPHIALQSTSKPNKVSLLLKHNSADGFRQTAQ